MFLPSSGSEISELCSNSWQVELVGVSLSMCCIFSLSMTEACTTCSSLWLSLIMGPSQLPGVREAMKEPCTSMVESMSGVSSMFGSCLMNGACFDGTASVISAYWSLLVVCVLYWWGGSWAVAIGADEPTSLISV